MPRCNLPLRDFVRFVSLEPEEDPLAEWLDKLDLLDDESRRRISEADMYLPLDIEIDFEVRIRQSLDPDCLTLLSKLLINTDGIELERLCLTARTWRDPLTCTGRLYAIKLVEAKNGILLPRPIASDHRAQYHVGLKPTLI